MNCREARTAMLKRSLGTLYEGTGAVLLAHLDRCPECARRARFEAEIDAAFLAARKAPPFEVNVAGRVLDAIEEMPPPPRVAVPGRQLAWAGLAAAALTAVVLVSGALLAPGALGLARDAGRATLETGGFLARLGRAMLEALSAAQPLFGAVWDLLAAASALVRRADPLFRGAAAAISLAILILTSAVIGRDLRSRAPVERR
jgi:hypothetical protein